jgi:hypothetical protein
MSGTLTLTAAVTPSSVRMSIVRAKTAIYYIDILQSDGITPFNLTGSVLYFHASNGSFTIDKLSPSGGIVFTDAALGLATLTILPTDTDTLGSSGVFGMPCEFTLTGGSPAGTLELATGNLTISPNVGTP